jgi:hypothetical protein
MTTMSLVQVTTEPTHNSFTYIKQLTKQRHTEAFAMCLYTCPSLSLMYIHLKQSIKHFQQQQSLHKHTYTHTHTLSLSIFQYYDYTHQHSGQTDIFDIWVPASQIHWIVSSLCQLNTRLLHLSMETKIFY